MKFIIKIPKPCNEDWSKMTSTEKGMFCSNCKKEVLNYQYFSNDQLVKSLNENEPICGRFSTNQIDKTLHTSQIKKNQSIALLMGFTSFLLSTPVFSQNEKSKTEITENKLTSQQVEMNSTEFIELSGKVLEKLNTNEKNASLPGVTIVQKGTDNKVASNFDGDFSIKIPSKDFEDKVVLLFNYIGMEPKEVEVFKANKSLKIEMVQSQDMLMGEVVIVKYKKRSIFKRIKNLFK